MPALEKSRLLSNLDPAELAVLDRARKACEFKAGERIFSEGDSGDGIYIVHAGLVQISALVTPTERRVLSRIKAGDFFGEMAVLDGEPRSASAIAEEQTGASFIGREKMLEVMERSPRLAVSLVREFSQRMREFNRHYIQEVLQAERMTAVGRFARSIVHDFKNPLHIIGLAAELADVEKASPEMRKTATARIRKQVDRLNNMVSELLEFTRAPQPGLVLAPHDFAQVINEMLADLGPEIEDKGLKLVRRSEPPSVAVPLDPKRLLHVFSNVLYNAVDALQGNGSVYLSFEQTPHGVVTEIEDTGTGIAPEIIGRLFEPFATFGKAKGSGLGLSICKKIIEDHRGSMTARNRPGGGAVFAFTLPLAA